MSSFGYKRVQERKSDVTESRVGDIGVQGVEEKKEPMTKMEKENMPNYGSYLAQDLAEQTRNHKKRIVLLNLHQPKAKLWKKMKVETAATSLADTIEAPSLTTISSSSTEHDEQESDHYESAFEFDENDDIETMSFIQKQ